MPPKSNEQRATTPEAASDPPSNNTPPKAGRNADYFPDSAKAILLHIEANIFATEAIALEPAFYEIFLNQAPQLEKEQVKMLEDSLGLPFSDLISQISNAKVEKDMYSPIARLLSGLTLLVEVDDHNRCLSLPKDHLWQAVEIATRVPRGADEHPGHIGAIAAMRDDITKFVKTPPKTEKGPKTEFTWDSMAYVGEAKRRILPTADNKGTLQEKAQAVSYLWSCSRNQVNRSGFLGFYACTDGLQFIWYGVSKVRFSPCYKWDDIQALFSFVYALHRRENMLEDTRLRLVRRQKNCLASYILPWKGKEYTLTKFHMDDGWRRKRFIAGGYSPEGQVVVVKLVWRQSGRRLNEAEACERIHQYGLVAGIVTLLGDHNDSPRLYELLPNEAKSNTTYIRQMVVYGTIGESLSSCESIKTFLTAMFDLVEILRFINTKQHLLHRDVSWSNILLNPRRIGVNDESLAKEQPESYAKFKGSNTLQNCGDSSGGVMTQPLGTVALLDLELCCKLHPVEGAKEGVDTTGTPMFIAMDRSHYRGAAMFHPWFFQQHEQFFTESPETSSEPDSWVKFWTEAGITMRAPEPPKQPTPRELPLHDVEPVFWVIVLFFIRASPYNAKEEMSKDGIDCRNNAFRTLSSNRIGGDDGRMPLLLYTDGDWEKALHPALRHFAPMLSAMASYFRNTWHFIPNAQGSKHIHGHEAMRRILWSTINGMDTDIPIDKKPAKVTMAASPSHFTMNTPSRSVNKRKIDQPEILQEDSMGIPPVENTKRRRFGPSPPSEPLLCRDKDLSQLLSKIALSHKEGKLWLRSSDVSYAALQLCSVDEHH